MTVKFISFLGLCRLNTGIDARDAILPTKDAVAIPALAPSLIPMSERLARVLRKRGENLDFRIVEMDRLLLADVDMNAPGSDTYPFEKNERMARLILIHLLFLVTRGGGKDLISSSFLRQNGCWWSWMQVYGEFNKLMSTLISRRKSSYYL